MFIERKIGQRHPVQKHYRLVGVYTIPEIYIVSGLLKHMGISYIIEGEEALDVLGLTIGPIAEKLLYVEDEDYEYAKKLLEGEDDGDSKDER